MSVRAKLLLAVLPLVGALIGLGALSMVTVSVLGESSDHLLRQNSRSVLAAYRLKDAIGHLDLLALQSFTHPTPTLARDVGRQIRRFDRALEIQDRAVFEPGERRPTARIGEDWSLYRDDLARLWTTRPASAAWDFYATRLVPAGRRIARAADEIVAVNQQAMAEKSHRARRTARHSNSLLSVSVLLVVATAVPFSLLLVRRLSRRLGLLRDAVERVDAGDFTTRLELPGSDEIGMLAARVNDLATHLDDYRRSSSGELLKAERSTQATIDSLPDPVVVFGARGHVLNVNRAAERELRLRSPMKVRDPLAGVETSLKECLERARDDALAARRDERDEDDLSTALEIEWDGLRRFFLPRATPVFDGSGNVVGVTVILQDVTRLRLFDDARNDLVATVAHELRTPLTSLRMAILLCQEESAGPVTDRQKSLLLAARAGCERLQALVAELLDLARIQSGALELRRRPSDVGLLIRTAATRVEPETRERGVRVVVDLPADLPHVDVDPERIDLVISNLLGNAVHHSPRGGSVVLRAAAAGEGGVRVAVIDEGVGVPAEHHPYVFEKFYRVPGAAGGGVGLGLAIARGIVLAHGGSIGLLSEPGRGSEFWFLLPSRPS